MLKYSRGTGIYATRINQKELIRFEYKTIWSHVIHLKPEGETEGVCEGGGVVGVVETLINYKKREYIKTVNFLGQNPLVLLVKVGCMHVETLGI
jgi:hypothetical protein